MPRQIVAAPKPPSKPPPSKDYVAIQRAVTIKGDDQAGAPSIELAKERARALLMKDRLTGELIPMDAPLSYFNVFGEGVASYMSLVLEWRALFWLLFLLSLDAPLKSTA